MFTAQLRSIAWVLGVAFAYYAAARLGLLLQLPGTNASPVWPPTGIGLAALLLFGRRVWPGILLGAFFANLLTLPNTPAGFLASCAIAVGNTLEQIVALLLIRRLVPSPDLFDHPRDVIRFVAAAGLSCAVACTNGATSLWLVRIIPGALYAPVWYTWWLGDLAGMLVLAPALYSWWRAPRLGLSANRMLELVLLVGLTGWTAELLFGGWIDSPIASLPFLYFVPGLAWAAFRFGPRETSSLAVLLSVIAVWHTWSSMSQLKEAPAAGRTLYLPFLSPSLTANDSLLMLQTFICVMVVTAIMLAAAVNERTVAERSLADSERRFRTIFEQAAVGVALVETSTGRFVRINQHYCDLVGYSADEMTRLTFQTITYPNDLPADLDNMRRLVAGAIGEFTQEKRYYRKDGSIVWVNLTVSPTWRPGEKPEHHIAIAQDITDRKRAEEALRQSEERFRLLVEGVKDSAIFLLDPLGHVTTWNSVAERINGYRADEIIGRHFSCFYPEEDARQGKPAGELQVAVLDGKYEAEERRVRKDGSWFWASILIAPWRDQTGELRGFTKVARDITERMRAEEDQRRNRAELEQRVQERTAELEAANQELEAFSYSVSHDLRAPLRAIDGFSRILMQYHALELSAKGQEYLQLVRDNSKQMGQLVDDLLTFARLSRQPIKKQTVEPAQVVRQCLEALHTEQEGRQVEVAVGELPACRAEPSLLKQVWMNLLANALKYTRKRELARIEVGCRRDNGNGEWIYYVKDNGVGFDMRYVHKLFGVFQRLHRAEDYEGTGVGLAIVQRIVHRHGGRVWAEAQPNQGATFCFTLGERDFPAHR